MLDLKKGVRVIKGCNLILSTQTTMADVLQLASDHVKRVYEVETGYKHVCLFCNEGLNFEQETNLWLCSYGDGSLISVDVCSTQYDARKESDRKQIALHCLSWLKSQGQITKWQFYDWGLVSYIEYDDRSMFAGINIKLNHPYNQPFFQSIKGMRSFFERIDSTGEKK